MKQEEWSCWLVGMHTCTHVYTVHIHKSVCIPNMLLHLVPCENVMGMFLHMHRHVFVADHMWFTVHLHIYMHMCSVLPFMFAHMFIYFMCIHLIPQCMLCTCMCVHMYMPICVSSNLYVVVTCAYMY